MAAMRSSTRASSMSLPSLISWSTAPSEKDSTRSSCAAPASTEPFWPSWTKVRRRVAWPDFSAMPILAPESWTIHPHCEVDEEG